MFRLILSLQQSTSSSRLTKTYYPFFLASDYTPLQYSPHYYNKASRLRISAPNRYQVNYTYLPQFLTKQIKEDKTLFVKDKEIMFVGRSNSGKSAIINQIFNGVLKGTKKKIARVAKKPGTTKFLHMHEIAGMNTFIVDSPGYGFAKMNKRRRQMWFGLCEQYLKISSRVSQIFMCVNLEHGLKPNDYHFLTRSARYNINVQIILTKSDKVNPKKYFIQLQSIVETIKRMNLPHINPRIISCSSKNRFGINILRARLIEAIEKSQQRNIDTKEDLLLGYLKELRVVPTKIQDRQRQQSKEYIVRKLIYNSKLSKYLM